MAKIISAHGIISAAEIKSNAEIPLQDNITVSEPDASCVLLPVTLLKTILNADSTSVGALCCSANVNKFSHFSPVNLGRDGNGRATASPKYPYSTGYFAGYNHDAKPCTWFNNAYITNWTQTKTATYQFDTGFTMRRGERAPDDIETRWSYIRLKAVITDNTNSRTITIYSDIFAITGSGYVSVPLIYTDSSNVAILGTVTITGEYVNSTGTTVYGLVEDEHPQVNINISQYAIVLAASNFANAFPITLRFYYVQNTISPYNNLVYWDYGSDIKLIDLSAYNAFIINGNLLVGKTTSGLQIPAYYGTSYPANQWPLVFAVTYNSGTGEYRKYTVTEIGSSVMFDTIYRSPADMTYIYKLAYAATLSAWPTTV